MYHEELTHKKLNTFAGILLVVAIVVVLLFLVELVSFLQARLQVYWIQFILYGGLIVAVYFFIKYYLTEYIYLIEKDRLTFGRRIGSREKELLSLPFREIASAGDYTDMLPQIKGKKIYRFNFRKKHTSFVLNCSGCAVLVGATQEYKDKIDEIIARRAKK